MMDAELYMYVASLAKPWMVETYQVKEIDDDDN